MDLEAFMANNHSQIEDANDENQQKSMAAGVKKPSSGIKPPTRMTPRGNVPPKKPPSGKCSNPGTPSISLDPASLFAQPSPQPPSSTKPPVSNASSRRQSAAGNSNGRRLTADASELADLLRGLISPAESPASSRRASLEGNSRRLTADAATFQQLLRELDSPAGRASLSIATPQGKAIRDMLNELKSTSTDESCMTADLQLLERLVNDLDTNETGEQAVFSMPSPSLVVGPRLSTPKPPRSFQPPASSSHGAVTTVAQGAKGKSPVSSKTLKNSTGHHNDERRLTADPCSLESLVADLDNHENELLSCASGTDQKKAKSAEKPQRRTTASPTSLQRLMRELDEDDDLPLVPCPVSPGPGQKSIDSLTILDGTGIRGPSSSLRRSPRFQHENRPAAAVTNSQDASPALAVGDDGSPATEASPEVAAQDLISLMSPAPTSSLRKPLRSCLSSRKNPNPAKGAMSPPGSIAKKTVVFGSPDAALFYKNSPTTSFTPMARQDIQRLFPSAHKAVGGGVTEGGAEEEQPETGVTAENSAILAAWEEGDGNGSGDEGGVGSGRRSTSSTKRRRSVSRSPRPKRRQSLLLTRSPSGGVYGITAEEEDEDEGIGDAGRKMKDDLQNEHGSPMDEEGSNEPESPADEDDMPDIRIQSTDFRSQDERTSAELGK